MSPRARRDEGDILDATIRVIADHGVSGATVDTVAARAGVSKATIYRHWGSRARLIHAALSSLEGPYVATEGDSLREDYQAARAAGLSALLLDREDRHPGAQDRIRTLAELPPWIDQGAG